MDQGGGSLYGYFGMAFGFGILILGVIVALVVTIQKSKTQRLETQQAMSINLEDEFRKLTGSFSDMQHEIKNRQDKSSEELSQIRTRIEKIEKMLSEVD
ncbi:hypothetical protein [Paenibacillus solani]|uniref:hypothetical protein n=1 Tax=Paenibacillus solani TaxID=1705565 RepID=UPI003D2815B5